MISSVPAEELGAVLDLIAAEQADPARGTTMLGNTGEGVAAELDDLEPDWRGTVRVAREAGRPVGATLVEWDEEAARAWVFGPWVAGGGDTWARGDGPVGA